MPDSPQSDKLLYLCLGTIRKHEPRSSTSVEHCSAPSDLSTPTRASRRGADFLLHWAGFVRLLRPRPEPSPSQADTVELTAHVDSIDCIHCLDIDRN